MNEEEYRLYRMERRTSNLDDEIEQIRNHLRHLDNADGGVDYEDFDIAIDELIQRQNRMFRALARELRNKR